MRPFQLSVFAALALVTIAQPAAAGERPGRIEFEILRGGQPFGRQVINVTRTNGGVVAETSADLRANLGPMTVFRYSQRCRETWRDGALVGLNCTTRQNGRTKTAAAELSGERIAVTGTAGASEFAAHILPTSWWTRPPLTTREMINTETGARLPVRITLIGRETIEVGGQSIAADHIRVQGTLTVDLWYDDQGRWVSCAFSMSGQHMTYRLLTPRSNGPA